MIYILMNYYKTYVQQLYCRQARWHFWILCSWWHRFRPHCTPLDVSSLVWAVHSQARVPRALLQCDVPCATLLHLHSWCPRPHSTCICAGSERHPNRTKQALLEPCTGRAWSRQRATSLPAHSDLVGSCLVEPIEKSFLIAKSEVKKR